jgi:hypothetical protein
MWPGREHSSRSSFSKFMRKILLLLCITLLLGSKAFAQSGQGGSNVIGSVGAPTGTCGALQLDVDTTTGNLYTCDSGTWTLVSGGGGSGTVTSVIIAGTANQITATGTCTITTSGTCTLSIPTSYLASPPNIGGTTAAAGTFTSVTDSGLTSGDCVQASTGGLLVSASGACGTGGGGDTITTPNSTLVVGGTSTNTTLDLAGSAGEIMAGATPALTYTPALGKSGTAGTLSFYPASGNFTTTLGSAATASNTVIFFASVPGNGDLFYCVVSSTTCTFTDTGYAYNAIPNADLAHSAITIAGNSVSLGGSTSSFPSPGAIGANTPAAGTFTNLQANTVVQTGNASVNLGSSAQPFQNLYLYGGATYGTGYTELTTAGATTGVYVATLPANTGTIAELNGNQTFTGSETFNASVTMGSSLIINGTVGGTAFLGTDSLIFTASGSAATNGDVIEGDLNGGIKDSGTLLSSLAPLASPTFTGIPTLPGTTKNQNYPCAPQFSTSDTLTNATLTSEQFFATVCQIPANAIYAGKVLKVFLGADTTLTTSPTWTFRAKLCSVSGCGSGTVVPIYVTPTSAVATSFTAVSGGFTMIIQGQAAAGSSTSVSTSIMVNPDAAATGGPFGHNTLTTSQSGVPTNGILYLCFSVTYSSTTGTNSMTLSQLVTEWLN